MATNENELLVRAAIVDELSGGLAIIDDEVKKLTADVARLDAAGTAASSPTRGLGRMAGASGELTRMVKNAHSSILGWSADLGGAFARALKVGTVGLVAMAGAAAFFGLKAASNFQQTRIAFDTMLGSQEKGAKLFADLQKLNLRSPFELGQITQATQVLLRYGVAGDKVVGVVQGIANAAALSGPRAAENLDRMSLALGQVVAKGKLQGEEARQLAEAGINAYLPYMKALGLTRVEVEKLGEAGKLSGDILLDAVAKGEVGINGLNDAAAKMSMTLGGQFSNLKDLLTVGLADASGPLVGQLSTLIGSPDSPGVLVKGILGLVSTVGPPLFGLVGTIVGLLAGALPLLAPILNALAAGAGRLLTAMAPGFDALQPVAGELAISIGRLVDSLVPVMPDLVAGFVALVGVLPRFVDLLADLVPLVAPVLKLFAGFLELDGVQQVLAYVLTGLLAYRAVSGVVGGILSFAKALQAVRAALLGVEVAEAAGAATSGVGAAGGLSGLISGTGIAAFGAVAGWAALALAIGAAVYGLDQWLNKGRLSAALLKDPTFTQVGNPGSTPAERAAQDAAAQASSDAWLKNPGSGKIPATDPQFGDAFSSSKPKNTSDGTGYLGTMTNEQRDQWDTDLARQGYQFDEHTGKTIQIDPRLVGGAPLPPVQVTAHVYGPVDLEKAVQDGIRKSRQQMDERK